MNLKKPQVIYNRLVDNINIKLGSVSLQTVNEYTYLSQLATTKPDKEKEIRRRITMGWKAFGRASSIFKSKIPISLKKQVYDQSILPTITYGAET